MREEKCFWHQHSEHLLIGYNLYPFFESIIFTDYVFYLLISIFIRYGCRKSGLTNVIKPLTGLSFFLYRTQHGSCQFDKVRNRIAYCFSLQSAPNSRPLQSVPLVKHFELIECHGFN